MNTVFSDPLSVTVSDPDVAEAFPNEAAVNEALRLAIHLAEIQRTKKRSIAKLKNHKKTRKKLLASY